MGEKTKKITALASKWCHACKRKFYNEPGTTDVNKRKKVNLSSAFPFLKKFVALPISYLTPYLPHVLIFFGEFKM